ncbi:MAG: pilus assembly protein TadG-related protein [Methylacidiphilales bacterium]|nr:pilus assembly protein TadG-related protein [Candidatus Methylacidiphilales bacterium]
MKDKIVIPAFGRFKLTPLRRGQMLVLFAILTPLFFGMLGLSIDAALMYHTKAQLSRAADAVALRMVRQAYNSSSIQSMRESLALSIMQDNMPGYMKNPGTWASSGDLATGTSETLTLSSTDTYPGGVMQKITIYTQSFTSTGVIQSTITAEATHTNLFLPIFSSNLKYVHFSDIAQGQRYPSVNILVLDISASMYGNGGATGILGSGSNKGAVQLFVDEFDETRDYMMVVTFSSKAEVIWPKTANFTNTISGSRMYGLPYFGPAKMFVTGDTSTSSATYNGGPLMDSVNNYLAYCSVDGAGTNGAEGLRYAAENVQKWLDNTIPDATNRSLTRINYIFMTDGGFNLVRSYVRGPGFGMNLRGNTETAASRLSVHNTFHDFAPLVGAYISSTASWKSTTSTVSRSMTGLTNTNSANMPGICANFAPTNLTDSPINTIWWAPTNPSTQTVSPTTTTTSNSGVPGYSFTFSHLVLTSDTSSFNQMSPMANITITSSPSILDTEEKMGVAANNKSTPRAEFDRLVLPLQVTSPLQNPARGTDFYLAANGSAPSSSADGNDTSWTQVGNTSGITRNGYTYVWLPEGYYQNYRQHNYVDAPNYQLTDARVNSYPVGAYYAPLAGCPLREMGLAAQETYTSGFAPTSTSSPYLLFPSNNEGWYSISARITDYYPDYTMCGNGAGPDTVTGATNTIGDPKLYEWWSFMDKQWYASGSGSIAGEAYWLAMCQSYVLRYKDKTNALNGQNATIYVIKYGTDNSNYDVYLATMANDPGATRNTSGTTMSPTIIAGQNQGKFYPITNGNQAVQIQTLKDAFKEIAARITVRLSQ